MNIYFPDIGTRSAEGHLGYEHKVKRLVGRPGADRLPGAFPGQAGYVADPTRQRLDGAQAMGLKALSWKMPVTGPVSLHADNQQHLPDQARLVERRWTALWQIRLRIGAPDSSLRP